MGEGFIPPGTQGSSKPKILPLQVLRGLLAIAVAVGHSLLITDLINQPLGSSLGATVNWLGLFIFQQSTAVATFFVISGYVLVPALTRQSMPEFLVGRAIRLWPVAWASMVIGILYVALVPARTLAEGSAWFNALYSVPLEDASVVLNALLIRWDFNGVLWSIYAEATAALFLPFFLFATRKLPAPGQVFLWIVLITVSYIDAPIAIKNIYYFLHCFYLGLYVDTIGRRVGKGAFYASILLLVLAELAMRLGYISLNTKFIVNGPCAFAIVSYVVHRARAAPAFLVWVGDVSYSFYAIHLVVMHSMALYLAPAIASKALASWTVAILSTALALPLGAVLREVVEKPALAAGRWLAPARRRAQYTT